MEEYKQIPIAQEVEHLKKLMESGRGTAQDLILLRVAEQAGADEEKMEKILIDAGLTYLERLARLFTGELMQPSHKFMTSFPGTATPLIVTIEFLNKEEGFKLWSEGHDRRNGKLPDHITDNQPKKEESNG